MISSVSTRNMPRCTSILICFWCECPHGKQCYHSKCKELLVAFCVQCESKYAASGRHVFASTPGVSLVWNRLWTVYWPVLLACLDPHISGCILSERLSLSENVHTPHWSCKWNSCRECDMELHPWLRTPVHTHVRAYRCLPLNPNKQYQAKVGLQFRRISNEGEVLTQER